MRPLKSTLGILSISPVFYTSCIACRNGALYAQSALRSQRLPQSLLHDRSGRPLSTSRPAGSSGPSTAFRYHVAASSCGKGRRYEPRKDIYTFDVQHHKISTGRASGGQDAYFISSVGDSSDKTMVFGVADGVGGWADSGIDSAEFSHALCKTMAQMAESQSGDDQVSPKQLLGDAYQDIIESGKIAGGGSTACVAVAGIEGNLTVANLGDSGFVQLRPAAIHYNSNPQTHAFNTPYQLSIVPPRVLALSRAFGGNPLSDMPEASDVTTHKVHHGDVLILATDGVWDNLSPEEILRIITRRMTKLGAWVMGKGDEIHASDRISNLTRHGGLINRGEKYEGDNLQASLAFSVVSEARRASLDSRRDGPFAREVKKFYPQEDYHGGKVDDICVVVAVVIARDLESGTR